MLCLHSIEQYPKKDANIIEIGRGVISVGKR
jgi:hypothetical protein